MTDTTCNKTLSTKKRRAGGKKVESLPEDRGLPRYEQTLVDGEKAYSIANSQSIADFSKLVAYYWGSSVKGRDQIMDKSALVYLTEKRALSETRSNAAKLKRKRGPSDGNKENIPPSAGKFPNGYKEYEEAARAAKRPRADIPSKAPRQPPPTQQTYSALQLMDLVRASQEEELPKTPPSSEVGESPVDSDLDVSDEEEDGLVALDVMSSDYERDFAAFLDERGPFVTF